MLKNITFTVKIGSCNSKFNHMVVFFICILFFIETGNLFSVYSDQLFSLEKIINLIYQDLISLS